MKNKIIKALLLPMAMLMSISANAVEPTQQRNLLVSINIKEPIVSNNEKNARVKNKTAISARLNINLDEKTLISRVSGSAGNKSSKNEFSILATEAGKNINFAINKNDKDLVTFLLNKNKGTSTSIEREGLDLDLRIIDMGTF